MTTEKKGESERIQILKNFNNFIKQIDIIDIRILSSKFDNLGCEELPSNNRINYTTKEWYENKEDQSEFHTFQQYNVSIRDGDKVSKKKVAGLSVTFRVVYYSKIPMIDEFFNIFKNSNLPLNTWPYFREFTHSIFSRMGWANIIAPAYKIQPPQNS
jgi:hypothetical protein